MAETTIENDISRAQTVAGVRWRRKYFWINEGQTTRDFDILIAEVDRLKAARRISELDNHHNALLCPYCNGPIKDEIDRLKAENEKLKDEFVPLS